MAGHQALLIKEETRPTKMCMKSAPYWHQNNDNYVLNGVLLYHLYHEFYTLLQKLVQIRYYKCASTKMHKCLIEPQIHLGILR